MMLGNSNDPWGIAALWGVFTVFFVSMTVREALKARRGLDVPQYNLGFQDMNEAQEILRQAIIAADRSSHRIAAWSYGSAAAVASFSLIVELA